MGVGFRKNGHFFGLHWMNHPCQHPGPQDILGILPRDVSRPTLVFSTVAVLQIMIRSGPNQDRLSLLVADIRSLHSLLEQIAYVARLRDPDTGVYGSPAIPERPRAQEVHLALCHLHEKLFRKWLNLSLEGQKADLELYLAGFGPDRPAVIRTWLNLESYRMLVPGSASPAERGLFFRDLKILLELHAIALRDPSDEDDVAVKDSRMLTLKEVAAMLQISQRTLRLWAATGDIPAIKAGRKWRFLRVGIQRWLRARSS